MAGLIFIVVGLLGVGAVLAVWQWWLEAHSRWLARLSARGLLEGSYRPWDAGGWLASPGWAFKQRLEPADALAIARLSGLPDDDRETEEWRVRSVHRHQIAVRGTLVGVVWLVIAVVLASTL